MDVQEFERTQKDGRAEFRRLPKEVQRPHPRNRTEREFEAAGPVDSELGRVRIHPAREVPYERARVRLVTGVPVRSPERTEVLVAIELPDVLGIADESRVQEVDLAPVTERSPFA